MQPSILSGPFFLEMLTIPSREALKTRQRSSLFQRRAAFTLSTHRSYCSDFLEKGQRREWFDSTPAQKRTQCRGIPRVSMGATYRTTIQHRTNASTTADKSPLAVCLLRNPRPQFGHNSALVDILVLQSGQGTRLLMGSFAFKSMNVINACWTLGPSRSNFLRASILPAVTGQNQAIWVGPLAAYLRVLAALRESLTG